jgi:hypothetical protein
MNTDQAWVVSVSVRGNCAIEPTAASRTTPSSAAHPARQDLTQIQARFRVTQKMEAWH